MQRVFCSVWAAFLAVAAAGCVQSTDKAQDFEPIDAQTAKFWDRQTTETAEMLREIAAEFNAEHGGLPVDVEHVGNYGEIFRKVSASIQAGKLPAMAVAYESMTSEYAQAGAVAPLDPYIEDPETGYTDEQLNDFFPVVLSTNRYEDFGDDMLSFPFCKSVLMLYFNKRVMAEAGIEAPPATWDQFIAHCRRIKEATGGYATAVNVDCSTIDGMIFSMGGDVATGTTTHFDSPEAIRVFEIIETLADEELAFQVSPGTHEDEVALAQGRIAYMLRSSSGRIHVKELMDDQVAWGMTVIPQANPDDPHTVLYGPNIVIFDTTEEQADTAWAFIKHFTSPEVVVRWALGSGYVPIRKSAANDPAMQAFFEEWPYNRAAFDCLSFARAEPNVAGWQKVRGLVEDAETAVLTGMQSAREAAIELKVEADRVLQERTVSAG
jgi:ABC-type glycerol-3-phosphate transport system substrate-binding protein